MRFIWFTAALAAGCAAAPASLKHTTRTLNPPVGSSDLFSFWYEANNARLYEFNPILLTKEKGR
ncbi:unnamed protein product [Penicillium olsonii]|nr:unnamed protein product [Penicillium olsonii]CAG7922991.1 unnamed protein product [Penicillium olsonii]